MQTIVSSQALTRVLAVLDAEASAQAEVPSDGANANGAAPEAPTATATENEAGGIELNIDLDVLHQAPAAALIRRRLLGPNWDAALPTREDFEGRKTLTLNDYKRRQGIV